MYILLRKGEVILACKTKITKQFIISQTILYVFIMAFVITFKIIFGDKNDFIDNKSIFFYTILNKENLIIHLLLLLLLQLIR